jgi:glycosyltransferase involved in cell wall biosynthesis
MLDHDRGGTAFGRGRTLVVAPEPPWPTINGVRTKLAGFINQLGSSVDVLSPPGTGGQPPPAATWTVFTVPVTERSRVRALASRNLPIAAHFPSSQVLGMLGRLLDSGARYDVLHLDTLATAHLAAPLRRFMLGRGYRPTIVVSLNDSYSLLLSSGGLNDRLKPRMYCHYVKAVERRLLPDADWVDVVSEQDLAWLRDLVPRARTRLIPLGVDMAEFSGPRLEPRFEVLYLGTMAHHGFHWLRMALDSTIGLLRSRVPNARIAVAGPDATPEALEYFARHGVVHLGFVKDLSALLRSTRLLLVSSRQRAGTPTKALQAMAAGTPVVGMEALDGIPQGRDNVSFSRATSWADLADRVADILSDEDLASRLGAGGRELAGRHHAWPVVRDRYFDFAGERGQAQPC